MSESTPRRDQDPETWKSRDPLGESLHLLRMTGVVYARSELSAPWGVDMPPIPGCVMFHVVTKGRCWLAARGAEPQSLQPGEFCLLPRGEGHLIASEPGSPTENFFELPVERITPRYEFLRHGGGGDMTHLICGAVRFDHPAARDLLDLLPPILRVETWNSPQADWMHSTLRLMAAESAELKPGGEAVVTRLADILVIQALRTWLDDNASTCGGWVGALRDERIGPAIQLMQREPERDWTLESLARAIGMSRSALAGRFRELVGETPMNFLARWRMNIATTWLKEGDDPVADIAERLGYRSEAAFSRAFKRVVGESPGAARRAMRSVPPVPVAN